VAVLVSGHRCLFAPHFKGLPCRNLHFRHNVQARNRRFLHECPRWSYYLLLIEFINRLSQALLAGFDIAPDIPVTFLFCPLPAARAGESYSTAAEEKPQPLREELPSHSRVRYRYRGRTGITHV
jgi:hypothetical protein